MTLTMDDTDNGDMVLALGRALHAALEESAWTPDARISENVLSDDGASARVVLTSSGSRQWLDPAAMSVLAEWGICVEPRDKEHWENGLYAEMRTRIPAEVRQAYERAVDTYGVPEPPQDWSDEEAERWAYSTIMRDFSDNPREH